MRRADRLLVRELNRVAREQQLEHAVLLRCRAADGPEDADALHAPAQRLDEAERDDRLAGVALG